VALGGKDSPMKMKNSIFRWIALDVGLRSTVFLFVFLYIAGSTGSCGSQKLENDPHNKKENSVWKPPKVTIVDDGAYAPFYFSDANGNALGITVELWELWSKKTGVPVEFYFANWDEALYTIQNGRYDVVADIFRTPDREADFAFGKAYYAISTSIFFHPQIHGISSLKDLGGFKVGVVRSDSAEELIKRKFPKIETVAYPSVESMVEASQKGVLKVFVSDTYVGQFYLAKSGNSENIRVVSKPVDLNMNYFAVKKGNTELLTFLQQGFDEISEKEKKEIISNWTGVNLKAQMPWDVIKIAFACILAALAVMMIWSFQLKRKVLQATDELRRRNEDISHSERNYREIFNATGEMIIIYDAYDGAILDSNRMVSQCFGYSKDQMLRLYASDLSANDGPFTGQEALRLISTADSEEDLNFEWLARRMDGSVFWIEVSLRSSLIGDKNRVLGVMRDITERKNAQQVLRESEERYRNFVQNSSEGIYCIEFDQPILIDNPFDILEQRLAESAVVREANEMLAQMYHMEPSEMIGKRVREFAPDFGSQMIDLLMTADFQVVDRIDVRYKKSAYPITIAESYFGVVEGNQLIRVWGVQKDISESKATERERARLITILENTSDLVSTSTIDSKLTYLNKAGYKMLGWDEREELKRLEIKNIHPAWAYEIVSDVGMPFSIKHGVWEGQVAIINKNGNEIPVSQVILGHKSEDGKIAYFSTIMRDITAQLETERALREREETFRALAENMQDLLIRFDTEGRYLYANPSVEKQFGVTTAEIVGKTNADLGFAADFCQTMEKTIHSVLKTKRAGRFEFFNINGTWLDWMLLPEFDNTGNVTAILAAARDIEEIKSAQERIEASERDFRRIIEASPMGIYLYVLEKGNRLVLVGSNPAADRILGIDHHLLHGKTCEEAFPALVGTEIPARYKDLALNGGVWQTSHVEYKDERIEGAFDVFAFQTHPSKMVVMYLDVSERSKMEARLRESEEKFRGMAENLADVLFIADNDGALQYLSPSAKRMFGWEVGQMISRNLTEFLPDEEIPSLQDEFRQVVKSGYRTISQSLRMKKADGETFPVELSASVFKKEGQIAGTIGLIRDITTRVIAEEQKKSLEAQLRQQQKLESIGTLAGGVAHEINNPIAVIMNYAQLLSDQMPRDSQAYQDLSMIEYEAKRIAGIVKNLLAFSRQEKESHSPAYLSDILTNTLSLTGKILSRSNIVIDVSVQSDLPQIKCRSQQVMQVIMNLLTNARDSLNERYPKGSPDKKIEISITQFKENDVAWQRIAVCDYGIGITESSKEKIFDPFFTTKPRDMGTGLGLSVSHGIIKDHHGRLWFESDPQKGTCFYIDLPTDNGWQIS
jgi:PAS domain S-box-containing protein